MSLTDKRDHKIKCEFGVKDYLRYYKKNTSNPVDAKTYRGFLKDYLEANRTLVSNQGYTFVMPEQTGKVEIRKIKREVYIDEDGNIVNKLPINWKATNKLWEENEEAKAKKIRIRYTNEHTDGYVFMPVYIKKNATYKKKSLYKMHINRELSRGTYQPIMAKTLDAFIINPILKK